MRSAIAAAGAVMTALGALILSAGSARADTVTPLPQLSYVHQVLVDDAAGYVFISGGVYSFSLHATGTGVVVTDLAGKYVTTLDDGLAAEGMALSGGTLYAALDGDHAVAAIDIATIGQPPLKLKQRFYPLGSGDLPYDLALQSGKLWVSYSTSDGFIGEINVAAAKPVFTPVTFSDLGWSNAPDLAADPADSGVLAAADPGEDPAHMATYNVSGSVPVQLADTTTSNYFQDCPTEVMGLALTVGGGSLLVACNGFSGALTFDPSTLAPTGTEGAPPNSSIVGAVAVASDGKVAVSAAGGTVRLSYLRTLTASGAPLNTYEYNFSHSVMTNGLAWSSDDTKLYAVMVTDSIFKPLSFSLRIIADAVTSAVSLTGPAQASYGTPVKLSGRVKAGSIPPPVGSAVTISRISASTGSRTSFSTKTRAGGWFRFTDRTHPVPGRYSYTATYGVTTGSPSSLVVSPASAAVAMTLHGFYKTAQHGSIVYHLYHHTATVSAAVRVTPVRPGACVRLALQEFYRGKWRARFTTGCAALGRRGHVTATVPAKKAAVGHPYRTRAVFVPGHDTTVAGAESDWQYLMTKR